MIWAAQNVKLHRTGLKQFHHPIVGDFELNCQAMQLPGDEGSRSSPTAPKRALPVTTH